MFEITINIPGLKEFAEEITNMSVGIAPIQGSAQLQQAPAVQPTVPPVQENKAPVLQAPVQIQQTAPPVQPAPAAQQIPTTAPSYTLDELAKAAMTLMDTGRQAELQGLLGAFGVEALPALPKEQYGAFATALRERGAQI